MWTSLPCGRGFEKKNLLFSNKIKSWDGLQPSGRDLGYRNPRVQRELGPDGPGLITDDDLCRAREEDLEVHGLLVIALVTGDAPAVLD